MYFLIKKYGIQTILESKSILMAIATAIDCNDPPTMIVACQLLAGLAVLEYILSFLFNNTNTK